MKKNRVVIIVLGGLVQDIMCDQEVEVKLIDWDNIKYGGFIDFDVGDSYSTTIDSKAINEYLTKTKLEVEYMRNSVVKEDNIKSKNICCICHTNYVDNDAGFDTCDECLEKRV